VACNKTSAILRLMKYIIRESSLEATPFAAREEGSGEDVCTKEFIHCVHCVNRTLRLVASKEAGVAAS